MKRDKEQKNRLLIRVTILFLLIYAVWRLGFTIPVGTVPLICWIILTAVETIGLLELAVFIYEYTKRVEIRLPNLTKPTHYPDVDVFVFTINEPEELLAKTLFACKKCAIRTPAGSTSTSATTEAGTPCASSRRRWA
ncbi:MAG: hypothetical protein II488_00950 [Firmicutes bacterium]|nr:hypothetical protein [Bacillota bacterium]